MQAPVVTTAITLPALLYFMLTVIILPVLGWLINNGIKMLKNYTDIEGKVKDNCRDLETLKDNRHVSEARLSKVEDAIQEIRSAAQRTDEQFRSIASKLDQLPRLMALLESLSSAANTIVPRTEVDSRLRAAEDRLALLESDVRKGNKA